VGLAGAGLGGHCVGGIMWADCRLVNGKDRWLVVSSRPALLRLNLCPCPCLCPCRVPPTSRLAQIAAWLKGSSEPALIVFDECHKVGSSMGGLTRLVLWWGDAQVPSTAAACPGLYMTCAQALAAALLLCSVPPVKPYRLAIQRPPVPLYPLQAKNLLPSGGSQPTQTARAVVELQVRCG